MIHNNIVDKKSKTVKINFIGKNSEKITVNAETGLSVLEAAKDNEIDIEGACGGALACSTCHVVVEKKSFDALDPASEEEEDMLDLAYGLTDTSRLCCQIIIDEKIADIEFTIPKTSRNIDN